MQSINKIYIVACGTAYYAGKIGKYAIENIAKIPVFTDIASEFRYSNPFIDDKTLVIFVSQSGETADTLSALSLAKSKGAKILSITNVVGSSISRESDYVLYTWAGPEIAVASTKAYTTQLISFYMLAIHIAKITNQIDDEKYFEYIKALEELPEKCVQILSDTTPYSKIAEIIKDTTCLFYLGRGLDFETALEGALKLKEISYIYTEAFPAGELKHGPIALIENRLPIISLLTQDFLYSKMLSNIKEVKARDAYSISITTEDNLDIDEISDYVVKIPKTINLFMPVLSALPCQLIAYYTSTIKGLDVDKPRNLAKSVTVE